MTIEYDLGFDDGCKHTKKIYEAEIEALKECIRQYEIEFNLRKAKWK